MESNSGRFSVIISGSWNPAILSPDWLNANIFKETELQSSIGYPVNEPGSPLEIRIKDLKIYPRQDKLDIIPAEATVEGLSQAIALAKEILSLLPHTPIVGVGINFGFVEENDISVITTKFELSDNYDIDQQIYKPDMTGIKRSFVISPDVCLNLSISYDENKATIDFNFHHGFTDAKKASEFLAGDQDEAVADKYYSMTKTFLNTVYDFDMEEESA